MGITRGPNIITDSLNFSLDSANPSSYISGSAIWEDQTPNGLDNTIANDPTYETANGGGLVFDGTDDYAQRLNDTTFNLVNEFTFNFWIKYASGVDLTSLVGKPRSGWADSLRIYYQASTTTLGYKLTGTLRCSNTSVTLSTTEFTNICFVQNPSETSNSDKTKFYINGQVLSNDSAGSAQTSVDAPTFPLIIGGWRQGNGGSPSTTWKGNINIAQMYNRALSATEVLHNYNALKSRFGL
tara:strand:- start:136 stop:855 length:720 start_codon:yes stop_codon:yes gene_type:complete